MWELIQKIIENIFRFIFKIVLFTVKLIFNPYSPIALLIIGWLLTLLLTSVNDLTPKWIQFLINNQSIIFIIVGIWFIFSLIYKYVEDRKTKYEQKISELKTIIEQKNNQLEQSAGIILHKYGDFSNFSRQLLFQEVLKEFVDGNTEIDSCQIYKYSFCRDKNVISTKIQYEMGYCYEGVEINCMSQIYYSLSKNDYYKVKNIVDLWKEVISLGENVRQIVSDSLANKAMELFSKIHDKLRKISNIGDIQNREFTEYRLLYLLLIIFGEGYGNIIPSGYILGDKNRDIEDYLLNKKRTGILGSILLEDIFIFSHTGQSPKNGRVYISFPIEAFSIDYIVLCAVPKRNLSDTQEINKELKVLQCDFIKRLKKKINL